ncbi:MAG: ArsI/CadI family heavy metal resistance metalloenzyme [Terriglobales bacterium]
MTSKVHVSLDVNNIEESVRFYSALFGMTPTKIKPGYAKFDVAEPAINLTLQESRHCCLQGLSHMGIRVDSTQDVLAFKQRLEQAGIKTLDEMNTTCCYAVQDKIWTSDPTGYPWEVYVFKGDSETSHDRPAVSSELAQVLKSMCDCVAK